ncbi:MAG: cysteine desulfurase family protein, partial [Candidatus Njordarchaeota archaeon]
MSVKDLLKAHGAPPREIYFDLENSGFVPPDVLSAMIPYYNKRGYGNPAITHKPGWGAYELFYETKELLAKIINSKPEEIIFTHSGTEANNLAILGFLLAHRKKKRKIVTSIIEHGSVLFTANFAQSHFGNKVQLLPVDEKGFVDSEIFSSFIDKDTVLVSIQMVNQEIGTIQNIKELVQIAKDINPDIVFHTDAADAFGKIKIDVKNLGIDMLTISSHKILGPKGVGALFVREGIKLEPIIRGQISAEKLWPGAENIPAIAGFKKAIELTFDNFESNIKYVKKLRDKLMYGLLNSVPYTILNGPEGDKRVCDNVNISFLY